MFIIIGIMLTGMLLGYLLRSKRLSWIHKIITLLIWILLFLLGIDVGGNESIIKGLHTLGLEAVVITVAAGDRKSTRLNSSHQPQSRMPSSA